MNDTELDELLNEWKTPPVPPSLLEGVRIGIAAKRSRPLRARLPDWRLLIVGTAVVAVVFLLANTSAFPEKISSPPYTVDSEIILHQGTPGCPNCWMEGPKNALMTSYNQAGSEVLVSWSAPNDSWEAVFWAAKLAVSDAVERVKRTFLLEPDRESEDYAVVHSTVAQSWVLTKRATLVNSGCRSGGPQGKVVGQEVILDYPTLAAQYDFWRVRVTVWMAPALNCFALRATVEAQQADGSWTLESEKKALRVTMNR